MNDFFSEKKLEEFTITKNRCNIRSMHCIHLNTSMSDLLFPCIKLLHKQEQHVRKYFYKSLLNLAWLWSRARLTININKKYFSLPYHQFTENLILVFSFCERTKRDKSQFVTKFVGIIVTIFSCSYKIISQIPCKIFATQCFFTDHLKHKTVNKKTCGTSSAKPCQLCAH